MENNFPVLLKFERMNEWSVSVILEFDDEYSDAIEIIMAGFDKSRWKNAYVLKSRRKHYSSFSTDKAISKIKQELVEKRIPCSVHVGHPRLLT